MYVCGGGDGYSKNQLTHKLLDTLVRDGLNRVLEAGRAPFHLSHTFWWQPAGKDMEERDSSSA